MRPSEILREKRADVLKIAEKYGLKNLRVFGSIARGEDDEKSDVDLLVEFSPGFTLFRYAALIREMEEALGLKVDIVSQNKIKIRYRDAVLEEAVPL